MRQGVVLLVEHQAQEVRHDRERAHAMEEGRSWGRQVGTAQVHAGKVLDHIHMDEHSHRDPCSGQALKARALGDVVRQHDTGLVEAQAVVGASPLEATAEACILKRSELAGRSIDDLDAVVVDAGRCRRPWAKQGQADICARAPGSAQPLTDGCRPAHGQHIRRVARVGSRHDDAQGRHGRPRLGEKAHGPGDSCRAPVTPCARLLGHKSPWRKHPQAERTTPPPDIF